MTRGTVTDVSGSTLTVEASDGTTYTVTTGSDTTVTVTVEISLSDLEVGDTISVTGETNGSSVTATTIQRGELAVGGFGGPPPGAGDTSTTTGN
jgi:hypothetical protein